MFKLSQQPWSPLISFSLFPCPLTNVPFFSFGKRPSLLPLCNKILTNVCPWLGVGPQLRPLLLLPRRCRLPRDHRRCYHGRERRERKLSRGDVCGASCAGKGGCMCRAPFGPLSFVFSVLFQFYGFGAEQGELLFRLLILVCSWGASRPKAIASFWPWLWRPISVLRVRGTICSRFLGFKADIWKIGYSFAMWDVPPVVRPFFYPRLFPCPLPPQIQFQLPISLTSRHWLSFLLVCSLSSS